ncbi:hypothetical protein OHU11_01855 [Streptomyces sp. NBC_00257]|uniref:hypothetical protein n=1 Tax=unclassified Streptomyces TaxID=2593676 RepID=UPI00225A0C6F|nr:MULTISPECIES: hypothetical protein [unclassified Streptomyces]MCX5426481.1 hypothetical protein [Streptomyces sp. NBC_00062]
MRKIKIVPRRCAAIFDCLTYDGNIVDAGTGSYRLPSPAPTRTHADQQLATPFAHWPRVRHPA